MGKSVRKVIVFRGSHIYTILIFSLFSLFSCDNENSTNSQEQEQGNGSSNGNQSKEIYWKATFVKRLIVTGDRYQYQNNTMFMNTVKGSANTKMWNALNNYPNPPYYIYAKSLSSLESK